jgi:hypothetical protein
MGQKRTFALQKGMSALPPKADMCGALTDVRFGPKADIAASNFDVCSTFKSDIYYLDRRPVAASRRYAAP